MSLFYLNINLKFQLRKDIELQYFKKFIESNDLIHFMLCDLKNRFPIQINQVGPLAKLLRLIRTFEIICILCFSYWEM